VTIRPVEANVRTKMAEVSFWGEGGIIKNSTDIKRKPHFKRFKHQNTNLADNQKIEPHFLVLICSSAVLNCL